MINTERNDKIVFSNFKENILNVIQKRKPGSLETFNQVGRLVKELDVFLAQAFETLQNEEYEMATQMASFLLVMGIKVMDIADDSYGQIGNFVDDSTRLFDEISKTVQDEDLIVKKKVFQIMLKTSQLKVLSGEWRESRLAILKSATRFINIKICYQKLTEMLTVFIQEIKNDKFQYQLEEHIFLLLKLYQKRDDKIKIQIVCEENKELERINYWYTTKYMKYQ